MHLKQQAVLFGATGFYSGKVPFAPGTFGTLVGLFPCYILSNFGTATAIAFAIIFTIFAIYLAAAAEKIYQRKDPGCIVIDEIAGMIVTLLGIAFTFKTVLAGFILFRLFDILKPWPIRLLDKRLAGGIGIVADDIAAGVLANVLLRIGLRWLT